MVIVVALIIWNVTEALDFHKLYFKTMSRSSDIAMHYMNFRLFFCSLILSNRDEFFGNAILFVWRFFCLLSNVSLISYFPGLSVFIFRLLLFFSGIFSVTIWSQCKYNFWQIPKYSPLCIRQPKSQLCKKRKFFSFIN